MNDIRTEANKTLKRWVDSRNKENLDFFNGVTIISHGDGSHFVFQNSNAKGIVIDDVRFVLVATEHCGYHVFFAEDLERWRWYPEEQFYSQRDKYETIRKR